MTIHEPTLIKLAEIENQKTTKEMYNEMITGIIDLVEFNNLRMKYYLCEEQNFAFFVSVSLDQTPTGKAMYIKHNTDYELVLTTVADVEEFVAFIQVIYTKVQDLLYEEMKLCVEVDADTNPEFFPMIRNYLMKDDKKYGEFQNKKGTKHYFMLGRPYNPLRLK